MISYIVRMRFNQEDRGEIERIMHGLTPASQQEPGCVTYIPTWVESETATLLIFEQYADEAALEHHRGSPHFARYASGGLYQKMLDRQLEHLNAIVQG